MSVWDTYPPDYRSREVAAILAAVGAGECVSVVGLSGSGKSNLLGFLAHRAEASGARLVLVDCNRLTQFSSAAFFRLVRHSLGEREDVPEEIPALDAAIARQLESSPGLCLLLDRFDTLTERANSVIFSNLRALRDTYKYALTYVTATRRPLDPHTELAELFYANTLWLGPLSESDARWNVARYAARKSLDWDDRVAQGLIQASWGYPALLRAACEAYADGVGLDAGSLAEHAAVRRRAEEFWADQPGEDELRRSGLAGQPVLAAVRTPVAIDATQLTAKENLLWEHFLAHPDEVCEKDDLIRAVWPEDRIYERGIRDDSLAQLVRRLREKIEADPSNPRFIQTVPGRGYRFTP